MNYLVPNPIRAARKPRAGERGNARTILLLAACFFLGVAVSAFWFYRASSPSSTGAGGEAVVRLSDGTRAVLSRLDAPLEIRFYASLDPATVPRSVIDFAGRVGQLLTAYQKESGGKVTVTDFSSPSKADPNLAFADGVQELSPGKADASHLGLTLVFKGHKETLPRLSPEWEKALEPDLTRAIARLIDAARPVPPTPAFSLVNTAATQEVKALIPDVSAVSVEEGTRILREAALKEVTAAVEEMKVQVKQAEQQLRQALTNGPEADRQAAMKHLQQVQAEQMKKVQQIAARAQAQVEAFQQLKGVSR